MNNNNDNSPTAIVLASPPTKRNINFLGSKSDLEPPSKKHKMEDILFTLKKGNIIANYIPEEGEYLYRKTKHYFGNLNTEHPKYQGVAELAFLAMTPTQLKLFRSKEEYTDFVKLKLVCKMSKHKQWNC